MDKSYQVNTCACFTGHRDISNDKIFTISEHLKSRIIELSGKGIVNYYAGGALGFDLIAAVTVLNLKKTIPSLTLNLALPCKFHDRKWKESERELYLRVIGMADTLEYVNTDYTRFCMQARNRYMVDRSCTCISYMEKNNGGTYNTVLYAKKRGLTVINLADAYGEQLSLV